MIAAPVFAVALAAALLLPVGTARADEKAVAACQKHVESMLREATRTSYDAGVRVEPVDERTVSVAGHFTSQSRNGETTSADFRCKATRYGVLWTTSTQLLMPR